MQLIKSVSIENLVNQRDAFVAKIKAAEALIIESRNLYLGSLMASEAAVKWRSGMDGYQITAEAEYGSLAGDYRSNPLKDETFRLMISGYDAKAWDFLLLESGSMSFMSAKAIESWREMIYKRTFPPISVENIASTFENILGSRLKMMNDGIEGAFRALSWDKKTNSPVKFGNKIILTSRGYRDDKVNLQHIEDIVRFMHVMDNKPQPDARDGFLAFVGFSHNDASDYVSEYVSAKGFANGNLHVVFKRHDLVDKMNQVLADRYPSALAKPAV